MSSTDAEKEGDVSVSGHAAAGSESVPQPISDAELDGVSGGLTIYVKDQAKIPGEVPKFWNICAPQ